MKKIHLLVCLAIASGSVSAQISKGTWSLTGAAGLSLSTTGKTEISGYTNPLSQDNNRTISGTDGSGFNVSLMAGYFLKDNLEVGLLGGYSQRSSTQPMSFDKTTGTVSAVPSTPGPNTILFDNQTTNTAWFAGIYMNRYYAIGAASKWFWFMNGTLGFYRNVNSVTDVYAYDPGRAAAPIRAPQYASREKDDPSNPNNFTLALSSSPGVRYFITPRWAVGAILSNIISVRYARTTYKTETYINNGSTIATAYPDDVDKITTKNTGSSFSANLQLPSFTSGNVLFSMSYYIP